MYSELRISTPRSLCWATSLPLLGCDVCAYTQWVSICAHIHLKEGGGFILYIL